MKEGIFKTNLISLVHANELASRVIMKVAGNAISTTLNGQTLSDREIKHAVAAKMQTCLVANQPGAK